MGAHRIEMKLYLTGAFELEKPNSTLYRTHVLRVTFDHDPKAARGSRYLFKYHSFELVPIAMAATILGAIGGDPAMWRRQLSQEGLWADPSLRNQPENYAKVACMWTARSHGKSIGTMYGPISLEQYEPPPGPPSHSFVGWEEGMKKQLAGPAPTCLDDIRDNSAAFWSARDPIWRRKTEAWIRENPEYAVRFLCSALSPRRS